MRLQLSWSKERLVDCLTYLQQKCFWSFEAFFFVCLCVSYFFFNMAQWLVIYSNWVKWWINKITVLQFWANTESINKKSSFRQNCTVLKETVVFQDKCIVSYVCTIAALSSNNQFLRVLDALEWWERKSSDTQPSQNESIKWLPQRNCRIFKCLWE